MRLIIALFILLFWTCVQEASILAQNTPTHLETTSSFEETKSAHIVATDIQGRVVSRMWANRIIQLILLSLILLVLVQFYIQRKTKGLNEKLKEKTKALLVANHALTQSNEELEGFTHIASHDLKTPVMNIIGFVEILKRSIKNNPDPQAEEYLLFIKKSAYRLNKLINDVLEFKNLEHFETIDQSGVALTDIISGIQQEYVYKHDNQEAVILITAPLPQIKWNKTKLSVLLKNLIHNGLHYNTSKSPKVNIGAYTDDKFQYLSIRDNGIGIKRNYHDRIFKMFSRLHNHHEFDGSGLGLPVCKRIVSEMNGEIRVKSFKGLGSEFIIKLPLTLVA